MAAFDYNTQTSSTFVFSDVEQYDPNKVDTDEIIEEVLPKSKSKILKIFRSLIKKKKKKPTQVSPRKKFEPKFMEQQDLQYLVYEFNNGFYKLNPIIHTNIDNVILSNRSKDTGIQIRHGLISTIINAYSYHIPLILRPDDIWISIITAFALFVKNNPNKFKNIFKCHPRDKKDLIIKRDGSFDDDMANIDNWSQILEQFINLIRDNVKTNICDEIMPNFTTTTQIDKNVCIITLMTSLQNYFTYGIEYFCGLSKVTLLGTLEDWIKLKDKVNFINQFNIKVLNNWTKLLDHVLNQFIEAYKGNVDESFWQRICTKEIRGSGSQKKYKGWMLVFCPFAQPSDKFHKEKIKYILNDYDEIMETHCYGEINDDNIVECINKVPIIINNNGTTHNMSLYSGILGAQYENNELKPNIGFYIFKDVME